MLYDAKLDIPVDVYENLTEGSLSIAAVVRDCETGRLTEFDPLMLDNTLDGNEICKAEDVACDVICSNDVGNDGLSDGQIAGIVGGAVLVVGGIITGVVIKKKREKAHVCMFKELWREYISDLSEGKLNKQVLDAMEKELEWFSKKRRANKITFSIDEMQIAIEAISAYTEELQKECEIQAVHIEVPKFKDNKEYIDFMKNQIGKQKIVYFKSVA